MANGFVTESPSTRDGALAGNANVDVQNAFRFTCPGSGNVEISEIGLWASVDSGQTATFHLAIFTDDAANVCPEGIVSNSDSGEITATGTSVAKWNHTYSTKPVLTGGSEYWLTVMFGTSYLNIAYNNSTGLPIVSKSGATYPTFSTGAAWHTHVDIGQYDLDLYAVYVTSSSISIPVLQSSYRRRRF